MKIYKTHFLLKAVIALTLAGCVWTHTTAAESGFIIADVNRHSDVVLNTMKFYNRAEMLPFFPEGDDTKSSVTIRIFPYPATGVMGPVSVCAGTTAEYSTAEPMASYTWTVTGGTINGASDGRNISVTWDTEGAGTVEVYYENAGRCDNTASMPVAVKPLPLLPLLQIGGQTTIDWNTSTTLTVLTPVDGLINWYDALKTNLLRQGAVYTTPNLTASTTYYVRVQNPDGCESADAQRVDVTVRPADDALVVPEAITPNNDGYNDTWIIRNIDNYPNNRVVIYNRWGDKVYQTSGYSNNRAWDGYPNVSMRLGRGMVPRGTYFYQIDLNDGSGRVYKGALEVVH